MKTSENSNPVNNIETLTSDSLHDYRNIYENENSLNIFPDEEIIPDGPRVSISEAQIQFSKQNSSKNKTIREIILEEEIKQKENLIKMLEKKLSDENNTEKEKKSILNPDIEKITEVDPDEKIYRDIKKNRLAKNSRNRNQMF